MMTMQNAEYRGKTGAQKKIIHPLDDEWMKGFDNVSAVLDFGCGNKRLTPDLIDYGFNTVVGYDISIPLIHQAFFGNAGSSYASELLQLTKNSFDLVLCFSLFTSCPSTNDQSKLATFINDHTNTNAYLYISDYETVDNPKYKTRYEEKQLNIYGCFKSSNAIFRHHEPGHFDNLFRNWKKVRDRSLPSEPLNGNQITIHQYLYKKSNA